MEILIVDSDTSAAASLAKQLALRGCGIQVVNDSQEALALLENFAIDAAVLSLTKLGDSAIALIRAIKALRADSIVMVLVEQGQVGLSIRCMRAGASDDMIVPVDIEELILKLNRY